MGHVVVEVRDIDNQPLIQLTDDALPGGVETLVQHDIIGRLLAKSALLPGLAECYEQFFGSVRSRSVNRLPLRP